MDKGRLLLRLYGGCARAVAVLLAPHAEVVLHDLGAGRIAEIWNAASHRRVGDESLIDEAVLTEQPVMGPYRKTGADGASVRSVSAVLAGPDGVPIGLLCINLDVSRLEAAQKLLAAFVALPDERPAALFAGDWREAVNDAAHQWLSRRGLTLAALAREEKVELVAAIDARGLFAARRAAEHVAALLGVSRASIYHYLTQARAAGLVAA